MAPKSCNICDCVFEDSAEATEHYTTDEHLKNELKAAEAAEAEEDAEVVEVQPDDEAKAHDENDDDEIEDDDDDDEDYAEEGK